MGDYIKREDAYQAVSDNNYTDSITLERYDAILESIGNITSVDVRENVHAHWITFIEIDADVNGYYQCSACGAGETHFPDFEVPFCWKCGAIMDGSDDG